MEQEAVLKEQIETYVDLLILLGMQEKIDQKRVDDASDVVVELITKYLTLLNAETEEKIQASERIYASTLEIELKKRDEILVSVDEKRKVFEQLFSNIKNIKVAKKLNEHVVGILTSLEDEVQQYAEDVVLVKKQIEEVNKAEEIEQSLQVEMNQAAMTASALRNAQVSYATLNEEVLAAYHEILQKGNADQIDFQAISKEKTFLKEQLKQAKELLTLAHDAKQKEQAEMYVKKYQEQADKHKLELDEIEEKMFLHMLAKCMGAPVDSYESLKNRTTTIDKLVQARMNAINKLYDEGIAKKGEYRTLATQINHSRIWNQLNDLGVIEKNDRLVAMTQEKLKNTRTHIKGVKELEQIFVQEAEKRGRRAILPEPPIKDSDQDVEILEADVEILPSRKEVVEVIPASEKLKEKAKNFLERLFNRRKESVASENHLSIGDEICIKMDGELYPNYSDAIDSQNGVGISNMRLVGRTLFVTRGVILNAKNEVVYATVNHGEDLEAKAMEIGLQPGEYTIVIGVSKGDSEGKFVEVTPFEANELEKGWIMASDPHIMIVTKSEKMGGKVK